MSKVLGIIAEYNPFHNGHLLHLIKSRELVNSDYTICIMSGNFVQRGETAIIDKWSRTEMALKCGVDLVIELPTLYSISSAENFAYGAVKILDSLNLDSTLSFGSEVGDLEILDKFADVLFNEPSEYTSLLNHELQKGNSYPKARENALLMYINDVTKYNILSNPNNILGIEYLKSLKKLKSNITPFTIKRETSSYNSLEASGNFASASAIRNMLKKNSNVNEVMPNNSYHILLDKIKHGKIINDISRFEKEILYILRRMSLEEIAKIPDVTEGLEHSIKNACNSCNNLSDLISLIKTKRYTQSRIQRILLYALLGITKSDIEMSKKIATPYIRVLGFNDSGKQLISEICNSNPKLPVITSVKKFMDTNKNKNLKRMLEIDMLATDIYTLGYEYESFSNLDYTQKMVII